MDTAVATPDIYQSLDVLQIYLADLRDARVRRKAARAERERYLKSIEMVRCELEAAESDGDTDIAVALAGVLAEFHLRLAGVNALLRMETDYAVVTVVEAEIRQEPPVEDIAAGIAADGAEEPFAPAEPAAIALDTAPESEAEEVRCDLAEISHQLQACLGEIAGEVDSVEEVARTNGEVSLPDHFKIRAMACRTGWVYAEARDAGLLNTLDGQVTALRDRLLLLQAVIQQEDALPLPFDDAFWFDPEHALPAGDWLDMADLYQSVAEAQEAFQWYGSEHSDLGEQTRIALLNSIGARLQMLFRTLGEYGATDRLQNLLYGAVREAARDAGYLIVLHPDTSWETLGHTAAELPEILEGAKREAVQAQERRSKTAGRESAVAAVVAWGDSMKDAEADADTLPKLLPLLDACLSAGVPPTNAQVRAALLHHGPALLQELPKYAKMLDAVLTERKRRGLDQADRVKTEDDDADDLPEDEFAELTTRVREIACGKKLLLLGGTPKPRICEGLREALLCTEVDWPESKHGDRAAKFHTRVKRADLVIVAKNFASHELTCKSRDWTREIGVPYVLLPSGYGVRQIINQIYQQLIRPA